MLSDREARDRTAAAVRQTEHGTRWGVYCSRGWRSASSFEGAQRIALSTGGVPVGPGFGLHRGL